MEKSNYEIRYRYIRDSKKRIKSATMASYGRDEASSDFVDFMRRNYPDSGAFVILNVLPARPEFV